MKSLRPWSFGIGALIACTFHVMLAFAQQASWEQPAANQVYSHSVNTPNPNTSAHSSLKIGIINTKKCLEESKLGKQEQANFEKMKTQMESILQEKERALEDLETKLNDDDYMDSISDEAASELKRKKRTTRNEGLQLQNQYMQTLQQANLKIVQKLTDVIAKASAQVAQDPSSGQPFDVIFTDEAATYFSPRLDISDRIVIKMDNIFDAEPKDALPRTR